MPNLPRPNGLGRPGGFYFWGGVRSKPDSGRERRRRFGADEAGDEIESFRAGESGVTLRLPPQAKTRWRAGVRLGLAGGVAAGAPVCDRLGAG